MLLRFRAGNHLSLREPQELSLMASALKDDDRGLLDCPAAGGKLVPAAIIYGANASGKSNVVKALHFMQWQILYSQNRGEPAAAIARAPFGLDAKSALKPSLCEIDFVIDGVRYHYGFEASDEAFDAEWLVSYPSAKRTNLFSRKGRDFTFGRSLKGQNTVIRDLTRPNSLYLSAAAQNNHEELSKVSRFFHGLRTDQNISVEAQRALQQLADADLDVRVVRFLSTVGTGVVGHRRTEPDESARSFRDKIKTLNERQIGKYAAKFSFTGGDPVIELAHKGASGEVVYFDLEHESAGTRRLLLLLQQAFLTLDSGSVMVIDELDASLHTQACEAVVALFSMPSTNPRGAQLIATTHDTNLLRSPLVRRDQIWFTEKDEGGATHLYPLTDIATRQGDNIEKGYLQGRFGAMPFSGSVADILAAE